MLLDKIKSYRLLLGSKSPRRKEILKKAGFDFEVVNIDMEETFEEGSFPYAVALLLAEKKAISYSRPLGEKDILITADTIVVYEGKILGKPRDAKEAVEMLQMLSGNRHEVITGYCVRTRDFLMSGVETTKVWFSPLSNSEIEYYVSHYKPFDKAGAYGIQEWIGYVAVKRIDGSFFNVMGLPVKVLYDTLKQTVNVLERNESGNKKQ